MNRYICWYLLILIIHWLIFSVETAFETIVLRRFPTYNSKIHAIPENRTDYEDDLHFPYQFDISKSAIFHPNSSPPFDNIGMPPGGSASIAPGAHLWANGEQHPAVFGRRGLQSIWFGLNSQNSPAWNKLISGWPRLRTIIYGDVAVTLFDYVSFNKASEEINVSSPVELAVLGQQIVVRGCCGGMPWYALWMYSGGLSENLQKENLAT